jgi:enolase
MEIKHVVARQIFDSRGNPTVEVDVWLEGGGFGRAAVPSGASTGSHEAAERRDGGDAYGGKGVMLAVQAVQTVIAPVVKGMPANKQYDLDKKMCLADGTPNKGKLGANAILAVSLAAARAAANAQHKFLFQYVAELSHHDHLTLPMPMVNVLNGGQHAANSTDIQEWMIVPVGAANLVAALRMASEVFHNLKKVLTEKGYSTLVGDEGGFAPSVKNGNAEALQLLKVATEKAGYVWGKDIAVALDVAASELYREGTYHLERDGQIYSANQLTDWYADLLEHNPVVSIEDPFAEDDWPAWINMQARFNNRLQLVGDDLLVTNTRRLHKAIVHKAANAILIKPNQIGTLTETVAAVKMAQDSGWRTIMSHRSGETEDATIAHLAVGLNTGQIKTGSMSRSDRLAKYNELLRISEHTHAKLAQPFAL